MHLYKIVFLSILTGFLTSCASTQTTQYPQHWWKKVPKAEAHWWEILPQEALAGEVILSKRNELGILSNFAKTPFKFEGKTYNSVEGFWQMLKFPESAADSRKDVGKMSSFEAKRIGYRADKNMNLMGINWVTYKGIKMAYREPVKGKHYHLILRVLWAKLRQNKNVQDILLQTNGLKLRPDFKLKESDPPAWKYHKMWMKIRLKIKNDPTLLSSKEKKVVIL